MRMLKIFAVTAVMVPALAMGRAMGTAAGHQQGTPAQTHEHGTASKQTPAKVALRLAPATVRKIGPQLAKNFTFEPFTPAMPDHVWMKADANTITFLHFMKPVAEANNRLIFIGDGVRGKFCAENQPDQGKTGYVHFHSLKADPGHAHNEMEAMGHGGTPGAEGYWLRHIAVADFEMMGMHFNPGLAMNFMPTPPPKCGN